MQRARRGKGAGQCEGAEAVAWLEVFLFLRRLYSKTRDSELRWGAGHGAS